MKKLRRPKPSSAGKDSSGDSSSSSSRFGKKPVIFIAGALALAYWQMGGESEPPAPPLAMEARTGPSAQAPRAAPTPVEVIPSAAPEVVTETTLKQARARALKNRRLGISGLMLQEVNGVIKIPFVFKAQKLWCQGGDLDTVTFLRPEPFATEFLITIEALTGKQRGDKMRVSADNLFKGFEKTFQVEIRKSTESFGLYICRDKAKTNSCRGKDLESHSEIAAKIADKATEEETVAKDFQLYFQNFIIKDGELLTYKNTDISRDHSDQLMNQLNTEYGLGIPDFRAAWEVTKILRSMPAKIENNSITLTLPYNDPRCAAGGERPLD